MNAKQETLSSEMQQLLEEMRHAKRDWDKIPLERRRLLEEGARRADEEGYAIATRGLPVSR